MSSFILVHPTVLPQYTNVTDRQTGQTDNGLIAYGEPFYKRSPKNVRDSISNVSVDTVYKDVQIWSTLYTQSKYGHS